MADRSSDGDGNTGRSSLFLRRDLEAAASETNLPSVGGDLNRRNLRKMLGTVAK